MSFDADTLYVGLLVTANTGAAIVMYFIGSSLITLLLCALALGVVLGAAITAPSVPRLGSHTVLPPDRF